MANIMANVVEWENAIIGKWKLRIEKWMKMTSRKLLTASQRIQSEDKLVGIKKQ